MVTFDLAFGEDDVFTIRELPDNKAAAALARTVNSTGPTRVRTVVLISPEEVMQQAGRMSATARPAVTSADWDDMKAWEFRRDLLALGPTR